MNTIEWESMQFDIVYGRVKEITIYSRSGKVYVKAPFSVEESKILKMMDEHRKWIYNRLGIPMPPKAKSIPQTEEKIVWQNREFPVVRSAHSSLSMNFVGGEIVLRAGLTSSKSDILAFMDAHKRWIQNRLDRAKSSPSVLSKGFSDGVWVHGKRYECRLREGERVRIEGEVFFASSESEILKWLKEEAVRTIPPVVERWGERMGVRPLDLKFSETSSKWGSNTGNARGMSRIQICTWAVCLPDELLDYLVIHELAHDFERNHSDRFWAKVEQFCPDHLKKRSCMRRDFGFLLR